MSEGLAYRTILDRALAAVTGLGITGDAVFEDPTHAIAQARLPAVAVEPVTDPAEPIGKGHDRDYRERHLFRVAFHCLGLDPKQRDAIAGEVVAAVISNVDLLARGYDRAYVRTDFAREAGSPTVYDAQVLFDLEFHVINERPGEVIA